MTVTEQILQEVQNFSTIVTTNAETDKGEKYAVDRKMFTLMLSGISTCRKVPGIDRHMGYEELYFCQTEEDKAKVREHMRKAFGVTGKENLLQTCEQLFHVGREYRDFWGFWQNKPGFDIGKLTTEAKEIFEKCKDYAHHFKLFTEERGFWAWDINEKIGLCRLAAACGILTEEEFWQMTEPWVKQTVMIYSSWEDYAVCSLCGAAYFMFENCGFREDDVKEFFELNYNLLLHLMSENGVFRRHEWLELNVKKYAIPPQDIREVLTEWKGMDGCIASDRIMVDGCKVGFMYRKEPAKDSPDSGWRFFAGDESESYAKNPNHLGIYRLNTVCNYDEDIMPYLFAPVGTAFSRGEDGTFHLEKGKSTE